VLNETIYIGFSTQKKWNPLSWILRICQGVPYSHVYVRFHSDSLQRDLVYQASELSVHFVGWDRFREKAKVVKEYPIQVSAEAKTKTLQFAIDNAGKPYGWPELFGFVWICLNRKFGRKVNNPLGDKAKSFVCSELVAAVLIELGYKIVEDLDTVSPKDMDEFLATQPTPTTNR
jgi:uncharacterized protein YycO